MTRTHSAQPLLVAVAIAALMSAALEAIYYYGGIAGQADSTPLRASLVGATGALLAGFTVWRVNRARYDHAPVDLFARRTALLAIAAVVSLAGFWVGITLPVAAAAGVFGVKAVTAGRPKLGYATCAVAALALAAASVLCALGAS